MDKAVDILEIFTGYILFLFMALLFIQVVMRFVFNRPIYGVDESVTALMIWSMCLGWCTVYWDNGHAVLEFIMKRMPKWFCHFMDHFTNLLIVVMSWVYIPASWQLFQRLLQLAVADAEEDASRGRPALLQGVLLRPARSGDERAHAGDEPVQDHRLRHYQG